MGDGLYFVLMEFERTLFLQLLFGSEMVLSFHLQPLERTFAQSGAIGVITQRL